MPAVGHWVVEKNRGELRRGEKDGKLGRALALMSRGNTCIQCGGGGKGRGTMYVAYGLRVLYTL